MTPSDLGLPAKFAEYRAGQLEAIEYYIQSDKRFVVEALPTGSGKSLAAMSIALLNPGRSAILTASKGLQDQYGGEYQLDGDVIAQVGQALYNTQAEPRMVTSLKGRANYRCASFPLLDCHEGLLAGCGCVGNCPYSNAFETALRSKITITNYSKWLADNRGGGIGLNPKIGAPVSLLICDEAHSAVEELSRFMGFQIGDRDWPVLPSTGVDSIETWKEWEIQERAAVKLALGTAATKHALGMGKVKEIVRLQHLTNKMEQLRGLDVNDWVVEEKQGRVAVWYEFDCVWPGKYAERYLFAGVPRVLLMSATVRPKTMGLLGVARHHYDFREWKREFPKYRCPVYHIPTARLGHGTWGRDQQKWVETIDRIIESRLDRKGIVHTGSYDRQSVLLSKSRYSSLMIGNTQDPASDTAIEAVEKYRRAGIPAILVSPSFGTGWDFPGEECEYQIVSKLPFTNGNTVLAKKRKARDRQYPLYVTAQELVQWCGRGMRSEGDRCETFVLDDHIGWFMAAVKGLVPGWFEVRRMGDGVIPARPPKL